MTSFVGRMVGAAKLDVAVYEEVEADGTATGQAMGVVLLSSLAAGVGAAALGTGVVVSAVRCVAVVGDLGVPDLPRWHAVVSRASDRGGHGAVDADARVCSVGRRAASLRRRACLGSVLLFIVSVWMLVAMVVAVRQALDYTTTWRAAAVCISPGWRSSFPPRCCWESLAQPWNRSHDDGG